MARSSRKKSAKMRRDSDVSPLVYVAKSKLHGYGLFAAVDIPADLVLGRLVGMPTREDDEYVLWIEDDLGLELVNGNPLSWPDDGDGLDCGTSGRGGAQRSQPHANLDSGGSGCTQSVDVYLGQDVRAVCLQ